MVLNWIDVLDNYREPRDIPTVPLTNKTPLWFSVQSEGNHLVVSSARERMPSSKIKGQRIILEEEFEKLLELYQERKRGVSVSKRAVEITYHQVYWYGVIEDSLKRNP